jgi:hypothetical protein
MNTVAPRAVLLAVVLSLPLTAALGQEQVPELLRPIALVDFSTDFSTIERYNAHVTAANLARSKKVRHRTLSGAFGMATIGFSLLAISEFSASRNRLNPQGESTFAAPGPRAALSMAIASGTLAGWYHNREKRKAAIEDERRAINQAQLLLPAWDPSRRPARK